MQNVAHRIGKLYFIRIILCIEEENKRKYAFIRLVIRMKLGLVETAPRSHACKLSNIYHKMS